MDTRKIQEPGGGAYTVPLPKEWATSVDTKPGEPVNLHTHIDGTLVVEPCAVSDPSTFTLEIESADPSSLDDLLGAGYAAGIETIELTAPNHITGEQRATLREMTRYLSGLTISEANDQTIRVRSLLDAGDLSIEERDIVHRVDCNMSMINLDRKFNQSFWLECPK